MRNVGKVFRLMIYAAAAGVAVFAIGFLLFAHSIARDPGAVRQPADGIVVLTGGQARISEAVKLLDEGKAQRLLITGVHEHTSRAALAKLVQSGGDLFKCCVDLDHKARDTAGNATETRSWAKRQGFSSLIIVTSSYHMPRSLAELERAMPGVELIPYSVVPRNFRVDAWWFYPGTMRILFLEYLKYIPAFAQLCVARAAHLLGADGSARSMAGTS